MVEFDVLPPRAVQNVAVTGAGTGIGQAVARQLAARGFNVAVLGRTLSSLEATAADHSRITPFVLDVADPAACQRVFEAAAERLGPLDALVANAGVYPRAYFLDQSPAEFASALRINVEGVANAIRPVLPGMLARNCGRIVVVGSLADLSPLPGSIAYSASKGALHALVKGLAAEVDRLRYPNVLINELTPGATRTAMSDQGQMPEEAAGRILALVDLPSGGPSGAFFYNGRRMRLGETWKQALKRVLLRRD